MLKFETHKDNRKAKFGVMGGRYFWTFTVVEHENCCELVIRDTSGNRRRMGKEMFETPSQAMSAANAFVVEFLSRV